MSFQGVRPQETPIGTVFTSGDVDLLPQRWDTYMTLRRMFECPECGRLKDQREQGGMLKRVGWCNAWKDHEGLRRRGMRLVLVRVVNRDADRAAEAHV